MQLRSQLALLLALAIAPTAVLGVTTPAAAATGVYYVDGKTGSDRANGLAPGTAFKTITKASLSLPKGADAAGWKVVVQGYMDYVYRERPVPAGWGRTGTSIAPIVFQAAGYVAAKNTYVRPIVSGADALPLPGTNWKASGSERVYVTPFTTTPFGFGTSGTSTLPTAIFQDITTWLWEQPSLSALATRASAGKGGYWFDAAKGLLYASAVSATGNPTDHQIDVITRNAFLIDGRAGGDYIQVRGFEVRHAANGIAYLYGADYGTIADNVLTGNLWMGIAVSGYQAANGPDTAVGFTVYRNRLTANTIQGIKLTNGVTSASVCYNEAWRNGLQGIKVEGKVPGSGFTGLSSSITLCGNRLHDQTFNPTGTAYNNASGITLANGVQKAILKDNDFYGNDVGVLVTQEATGMTAMNGIAVMRSRIWNNRRFGIYFFDGYRGASQGAGSMTASYDRIWGNGVGVFVDRGASGKRLVHETINGNKSDGVKVGGYQATPASISITRSLITGNAGFGLWLVTGNTGSITYSGMYGNARGAIYGTPTKLAVNTKPPDYVSTDATSANHLKINATSFQYTAGPSGTPIGARY